VVIFGATLHVEETLRKTDKKQNVKLKKYSTIGRQKVRLTKVFPYSLPSVGPRADPGVHGRESSPQAQADDAVV